MAILTIIIAGALPVYAVPNNPDAINFGSVALNYQAFYNVHETGDMLFMAESYIHWVGANTPPAISSIAYIFELLSTNGLTVYASIPVWAYEDKPVSIYLTKAQVDCIVKKARSLSVDIKADPPDLTGSHWGAWHDIPHIHIGDNNPIHILIKFHMY